MAQPIAISDYIVATGKTTETDLAMTLAINEIPAKELQWLNYSVPTNFIDDAQPVSQLATRIVVLLNTIWPSIEHNIADNEVYLLLPEFSGVDNPELQQLLQAIMRQFPALLRNQHCKVFPFGRASALMAFAAARARLTSQNSSKVWLVAADSLAVTSRLQAWLAKQYFQPEAVASEAAIALCLTAAKTGLINSLHAADASVAVVAANANSAQQDTALAHLFLHVAKSLKQQLAYIMLPDTGEPQLTSYWSEQYQQLHGVINKQTQFEFPGYFTGELGAAGGLYRLLHMYLGFEQQRLTAPLLHCEIAERSYRAVSVFNYQSVVQ